MVTQISSHLSGEVSHIKMRHCFVERSISENGADDVERNAAFNQVILEFKVFIIIYSV